MLNVLADEAAQDTRTSHIRMCTVTVNCTSFKKCAAHRFLWNFKSQSSGFDIFLIPVQFRSTYQQYPSIVTVDAKIKNRRTSPPLFATLPSHAYYYFCFLPDSSIDYELQSEQDIMHTTSDNINSDGY